MSRTYEYKIRLAFRNSTFDPKVISAALRMRPHVAWRVGDRRMTPSGQLLEGFRRESHWSKTMTPRGIWVRAEVGSSRMAERGIQKLIHQLTPHAAFLRRLRAAGASPEIWLSSRSQDNYPLQIEPELCKTLERLGMTLIIDIYPYEQRGSR